VVAAAERDLSQSRLGARAAAGVGEVERFAETLFGVLDLVEP